MRCCIVFTHCSLFVASYPLSIIGIFHYRVSHVISIQYIFLLWYPTFCLSVPQPIIPSLWPLTHWWAFYLLIFVIITARHKVCYYIRSPYCYLLDPTCLYILRMWLLYFIPSLKESKGNSSRFKARGSRGAKAKAIQGRHALANHSPWILLSHEL